MLAPWRSEGLDGTDLSQSDERSIHSSARPTEGSTGFDGPSTRPYNRDSLAVDNGCLS